MRIYGCFACAARSHVIFRGVFRWIGQQQIMMAIDHTRACAWHRECRTLWLLTNSRYSRLSENYLPLVVFCCGYRPALPLSLTYFTVIIDTCFTFIIHTYCTFIMHTYLTCTWGNMITPSTSEMSVNDNDCPGTNEATLKNKGRLITLTHLPRTKWPPFRRR